MVDKSCLIACWTFSSSCRPRSEPQALSLSLLCWSQRVIGYSSRTGVPPLIGTASNDSVGELGAWLEELPVLDSPSPCSTIVLTYKSLVIARSMSGALALVIRCSTLLKWSPQISLTASWCLCLCSFFHSLVSFGVGLVFGANWRAMCCSHGP